MKKKLLSAIASALTLAMLIPAATFAGTARTEVDGTVTNGGSPVKNAVVEVTCGSVTKQAHTDKTGAYVVGFAAKNCPAGSTVTVTASKNHVGSGSNTGKVNPADTDKLNVAIVNVSVPEFGLVTAGAAVIVGGAAFAVVRRRQLSGHQA